MTLSYSASYREKNSPGSAGGEQSHRTVTDEIVDVLLVSANSPSAAKCVTGKESNPDPMDDFKLSGERAKKRSHEMADLERRLANCL
jgi:hypothetical protein